jgi:electron transfer flavoprotein beta subunit
MRVVVCCKGVPVSPAVDSIRIANGDIHSKESDFYINEFDAYALEAALYLKNSYGTETVALTVGPLRVQEVLYVALAKGIDRVQRIDGETGRPELIASALVPAVRDLRPELTLVGVQSEDWMGGEVGAYLSQALDLGLAFAVVEICELTESHVRIKKEIGSGRKAEVVLKLPSVLCVQSGIRPIRYLSMMKLQKARNNPIQLRGKLDLENSKKMIPGMLDYEVTGVSLPAKEGHAEMIEGSRPEKASRLLEVITKAG